MFSWKRDSADISEDEPIFRARYIGFTETLIATGSGCTTAPLRRLWTHSHRKSLRKVTVQISTQGVFMYDADNKIRSTTSTHNRTRTLTMKSASDRHGDYSANSYSIADGGSNGGRGGSGGDDARSTSVTKSSASSPSSCYRYFNMEDISYCAAADRVIDDRLFCWIARRPETMQMELHAVLCSGKDKAQTMAAVLSRAFRHAYRHWKLDRERQLARREDCGDHVARGGLELDLDLEGGEGGGGGGGGGGEGGLEEEGDQCIGLSFHCYGRGGNPLNNVKLSKGSQSVGRRSTTSV